MQPISTVNVNIATCYCGPDPHCKHDNKPIPLPCPLPPSVTFEVRPGECNSDGCTMINDTQGYRREMMHGLRCPARPIRVSCSISGDTWAESEVTDAEEHDAISVDGGPQDAMRHSDLMRACRERWALVKALVLGKRGVEGFTPPPQCFDLMIQRDAVYAKLAALARLETDAMKVQQEVDEAFLSERFAKPGDSDHRAPCPSVNRIARFVAHIVEQVGVLP